MQGNEQDVPPLGRMIGRIARRWRQMIDARLQPYGVTDAMWLPLLELDRAVEPMHQKDIAASLGVDNSAVVRVLSTLERRGLVRRVPDSRDRRARAVSLTEEGRQRVSEIYRLSGQMEEELLAGVTPEELKTTRRVLGVIMHRIDQKAGG
ncbi:MarR family winged helix-turn-helix transcriptional regulator [Neokomagataea thailandica]|uniref:MarR family transcriptional regulator n=1 Tax=Neokomagataea tanensis NBRC 106556 TaxID=1223519 RepID=A0ABQ0QJ77_9PROT|nr:MULTISPECIES: MarR family transcriptional regulator [Neokomagataea]GBR46753.1 MarR family transcriptional regulator [Neokomagataea tanensis NBRC 106556]